MKIHKIKAAQAVSRGILCALCMLSVQSGIAQTPGNITSATHITWLTPDGYNKSTGTWTNRISGTNGNGNYIKQETAPATATGYNYHPSVVFEKKEDPKAPNRLQAQNAVSIAVSDNITSVFVLKRKTGSHDNHDLFAFRSGHSTNDGHLVWNYKDKDAMELYWNSSITVGSASEGIISIDNANNTNSDGINFYHNGTKSSVKGSSYAYSGEKWVLGAGWKDYGWGYEGEVQEVIILKAGGSNSHLSEAELLRLHSYLAVKYGITLSTNYVNSDNVTVWNSTANVNYNNNIFGIARDDKYGLHQKQSKNVNDLLLSVFVGPELMPLNSQNTSAALADGVYAMFGSNNGDLNTEVSLSDIPNSLVPSHPVNYRKGLVYKVQVTGASTIKLKMRMPEGILLPEYMLISSNENFTGATLIPLRSHTIEVELPAGGSYIAFGGHKSLSAGVMPAGIASNNNILRMWLDASNVTSIKSTNEDLGASVLSHDILKGYNGVTAQYLSSSAVKPVNNRLNTVQEWRDDIRKIKYELYNNDKDRSERRVPVYSATPLEMNYHPAVQFWGNENYGSYLTNTKGVFGNEAPANNEHTTIFVVNNYKPVADDRSYYMAFGKPTPTPNSEGYRPTYGIMLPKGSNATYAVMNTSTNGKTNSSPLAYTTGSTAIMAYRTNGTGTNKSNHKVTFGINGQTTGQQQVNDGFGTFGFNANSTMGIGYNHDRQLNGLIAEAMIFETKLSDTDLKLVEAYLAVKYGITLKESGTDNYDYKMKGSNGFENTYWPGKSNSEYSRFHNNVAAIIRDDESNLYNRQSHSTEVGSMLHVGIGGVPEAVLDKKGTKSVLGSFEHSKEVVVWGHNNNNGSIYRSEADAFYPISPSASSGECYTIGSVFKRRWLLHKSTEGNRSMQLLVGLQNNSDNNLGATADNVTKALYNQLKEGNELYMIVATSEAALNALTNNSDMTQLKAIVPMTYSNNEFQCSYNFTEETCYITFGVKEITVCTGTKEFAGKKTFNWKPYYPCTFHSVKDENGKDFAAVPFDLGDGITGKTHINYAAGITVPKYYPSSLGAPGKGITIRRVKGDAGSKVTVEIAFDGDIMVKPEFRISGLDEVLGRYEQVKVSGYCSTNDPIAPTFRPVSSKPKYTISGNTVTSLKGIRGASDKHGAVDVSFSQGVRRIVIEYSIVGKAPDGIDRNIYISPIKCTSANVPPPPPPVNEDGLAFTKEVESGVITTCETMQYSFYITNANYGAKTVNFSDKLPDGLKWKEALVVINAQSDQPVINEGTRTLEIKNIIVPCNSTIKLTAVVEIDSQFAEQTIGNSTSKTHDFENRAEIKYKEGLLDKIMYSVDRQTLEENTVFTAIYQPLQDAIKIETSVDPGKYFTGSVVTVNLKLTNNSNPVDKVFLNVYFGAGFTYVPGSYSSTPNIAGSSVYQDPSDASLTVIGGYETNGDLKGFTLPTSVTEFTFKLKAPDKVQPEYDTNGNPIAGSKAALEISYDFSSDSDDACLRRIMEDLSGVLQVPWRPTHIIINSHITANTNN